MKCDTCSLETLNLIDNWIWIVLNPLVVTGVIFAVLLSGKIYAYYRRQP